LPKNRGFYLFLVDTGYLTLPHFCVIFQAGFLGINLLPGLKATTIESEVRTMVEVKRKDNESFESLLRRFNRKIQQSGVLVRARKIRFFAPTRSRNLLREDAVRRAGNREKREELKKLGKLPVYTNRFRRR
jgi:ribosomal protein S21